MVDHPYLNTKTPKGNQPSKPPPKKASRESKPVTQSSVRALKNQLKKTKLKDTDPNKHAWVSQIKLHNLRKLPSGIKPAPKLDFQLSTASDWEDDPEEPPTASTAAASRPVPPPRYMDKDSSSDSD